MADIIKIDYSVLPSIKNEQLRAFTNMLASEIANMHKYMIRASVVLAAIDASKCYEEDGFESIHDYTAHVLGIKKAQSYAILKVGKEYIDTNSMQSKLPHKGENDYTMTQLQALLPLKSVDTAIEVANQGLINPDMTVKQIKAVVKDYRESLDGENNDVVEATAEVIESSEDEGTTVDVKPETKRFKVEHTIKIGHYENGEAYACVDGKEVAYEDAYAIIANGYHK